MSILPQLQRKPILPLLLLHKASSDDIIRLNLTKRYGMSLFYDTPLTVPITVDGRTLNFMVDTGSPDTFVIYNDTIWDGRACDPTIYGFYECNQPICNKNPLKLSYVDGTKAEIIRHKGDVTFGDQKASAIEFGLVKTCTNSTRSAFSTLGLALEGRPGYPDTFLNQLLAKGIIKHKEFSIYFNPYTVHKGELLIGEGDPTKYYGELSSLQVTERNAWYVRLDKMKIGGMSALESPTTIQFDSGTDHLIVPEEVFNAFATRVEKSVEAAGGQVRRSMGGTLILQHCKGYTNLPDIELTLGGITYRDDFVLVMPGISYTRMTQAYGDCVLSIGTLTDHKIFIMPLSFLRNYYVNFNIEKKQIRIAKTARIF